MIMEDKELKAKLVMKSGNVYEITQEALTDISENLVRGTSQFHMISNQGIVVLCINLAEIELIMTM